MRSSAAIIRELSAAGATPEIIAIAIDALDELRAEAAADLAAKLDELRKPGRTRAKRWRDAHKPEGVTLRERDETSPQRDVTDTERHANAESPPFPPPDKAPPNPLKLTPLNTPPERERTRGREATAKHRLPADWRPEPFTAGTQAAARAERMGADWVDDALEQFCAHWAASGTPNAKKCNWQQAWINWLQMTEDRGRARHDRRQTDFGNRGGNRPDPIVAAYRNALAEVEAEESSGEDSGFDFGARLALPPGRSGRY